MKSFSIIVPVHKLDDGLYHCLESLKRLDPKPSEVVIALDGLPFAGLHDFAPDLPSFFVITETKQKMGAAAARNAGVTMATGECLVFVDSDVSVPEDLLQTVRSEFVKAPEVSALFGSYDAAPGQDNFLSQFKNLMHHFVHQFAKEDAVTFWGACGAIKRHAFFNLGGFDESLDWLEDVDLGMRLSLRGGRIKLVKSLQVKHWKKWTVVSLLRSDIFHRAIPWAKLIAKYGIFRNDLNTDNRSRLSALLIFVGLGLIFFGSSIPFRTSILGILAFLVIGLSRSLYSFFWRKKGFPFLIRAILWHWLYLTYSSVALLAGIIPALWKHRFR